MITDTSNIFVSGKNYAYGMMNIKDLNEKVKKQRSFVLSCNTKDDHYSFSPIGSIKEEFYVGDLYNIKFENISGTQYSINVTPDTHIITKRGIIKAENINNLDVFIDYRGLYCKSCTKEVTKNVRLNMFSIVVNYTYNYFCNGILIRG
jgi:hypothetical protein